MQTSAANLLASTSKTPAAHSCNQHNPINPLHPFQDPPRMSVSTRSCPSIFPQFHDELVLGPLAQRTLQFLHSSNPHPNEGEPRADAAVAPSASPIPIQAGRDADVARRPRNVLRIARSDVAAPEESECQMVTGALRSHSFLLRVCLAYFD